MPKEFIIHQALFTGNILATVWQHYGEDGWSWSVYSNEYPAIDANSGNAPTQDEAQTAVRNRAAAIYSDRQRNA